MFLQYAKRPDDAQAHQGDAPPSAAVAPSALRFWQACDGGSERMARPDPVINFAELVVREEIPSC